MNADGLYITFCILELFFFYIDYTCVCILDNFKNEVAARSMERLMKKVCEKKATEIIKASE